MRNKKPLVYWFVQFDFPFDFAQGRPDTNGKPYKSSGGKMVYNSTLKREIPAGWKDGTLDDLGQIVGGSTPSTKNPDNFITNGTPWITPNDLSGNKGTSSSPVAHWMSPKRASRMLH